MCYMKGDHITSPGMDTSAWKSDIKTLPPHREKKIPYFRSLLVNYCTLGGRKPKTYSLLTENIKMTNFIPYIYRTMLRVSCLCKIQSHSAHGWLLELNWLMVYKTTVLYIHVFKFTLVCSWSSQMFLQ